MAFIKKIKLRSQHGLRYQHIDIPAVIFIHITNTNWKLAFRLTFTIKINPTICVAVYTKSFKLQKSKLTSKAIILKCSINVKVSKVLPDPSRS